MSKEQRAINNEQLKMKRDKINAVYEYYVTYADWGCPISKRTAIKINSQEKKRMIKFQYE